MNPLGVNGPGQPLRGFLPIRRTRGQEPWCATLGRRFTTWEAWHLTSGVKLALDYINLPGPAAGPALKVSKKRAKQIATQARRWAEHWYEITRTNPHAHLCVPPILCVIDPAPPSYFQLPPIPKWKAKFNAHVAPHNAQASLGPPFGADRDIARVYPAIWTITNTAPAQRIVLALPPPMVVGMGPIVPTLATLQAAFDDGVRTPHRVWQGGPAAIGAIMPPGTDLLPAEQAEILAECAGYVPQGMAAPGAVTVLDLTQLMGGPAVPRGAFFDRLPEFLCQLGGAKTLAHFL